MNLYLVQHAEARSKQEDPERSLSEQGQVNINKVAAFVARHASIQVRQIVHSGKTRARQTAEALANALPSAKGTGAVEGLAPLDDSAIWAERLAATDEDMMLVGHLPHLSKLAALLVCGDQSKKVVDFQMGGVVCLVRDEEGIWSVRWIVTPQIVA